MRPSCSPWAARPRSGTSTGELIRQAYALPLGDFQTREPAPDLSRIREIRFVFDRAPAGEVAIDQVGLSRLDPAFLSARVEAP